MKRFLFLDDDRIRHARFDQICETLSVDVWHASTVDRAIGMLNNCAQFDCAFLDHDLSISEEKNGWVVAEFISRMAPSKRPKNVVIHSWNPEGAIWMEKVLIEAGHPSVVRIPFSFRVVQ